jgi:hypothetical protein
VNGTYEAGVLNVVPTHLVREMGPPQLGEVSFSTKGINAIPSHLIEEIKRNGTSDAFMTAHYLWLDKRVARSKEILIKLNPGDGIVFNPTCVYHRSVDRSSRLAALVQFYAAPTNPKSPWNNKMKYFFQGPSWTVTSKAHPLWRFKIRYPTISATLNVMWHSFIGRLGGAQYTTPELHPLTIDLEDVLRRS